jgi:hypothetical protein
MKNLISTVCAVFLAAVATAAPRKVALIVQNHCSGDIQPPMSALADTLAASLTAEGLSVVVPANSIGATQNASAAGETMPKASAKELGGILGVDGILTASVQEFTSESIGSPVVAYALKTRLTLTLFDCATGGSVCATGMQQYSKNYTVQQIKEDNAALYEGFLHSSAEKCAAKFLARYAKADWEPTSARMVKVFFGCNVLGADIQIDGLSYGTCPAEISLTPGVHKLLVSYPPYYQEFRRDALFRSDGQTYKVVLQITPEGEKQRDRVLEYEKKLLELKNLSRSGDFEYEKKKKALETEQKERGELFQKQLELADAMLERYQLSGDADDYVRKTIAEGTAVYWKNSFGRIAITEGTADKIEFATPSTDAGDLSVPPDPTKLSENLQNFLMKRGGK